MSEVYKSYEDLPIILTANEISSILKISKVGAYNLMHAEGFPTIHVGSKLLVPKDKFMLWIEESVSQLL